MEDSKSIICVRTALSSNFRKSISACSADFVGLFGFDFLFLVAEIPAELVCALVERIDPGARVAVTVVEELIDDDETAELTFCAVAENRGNDTEENTGVTEDE